MSITVIQQAEGIEDELGVSITNVGTDRIHFHPWDRPDNHNPREVYIAVGQLLEDGNPVLTKNGDSEDMNNIIVDRADFVEAILAVFPELTRA